MTVEQARRRPRQSTTPDLSISPAPAALSAELQQLLAEGHVDAVERFARRLAERQWRQWRAELAPLGLTAAAFRAIVLAYRQEVWLWGRGDRSWEQMMEGLRGRVLRRAGTPSV
ncbi:MAG TPA: hypothetical protein VNF07_01965 [Acidimicrobiales bacterium]|nr:hypothetical protein [Acidimicrobiales bacterium]